MNAVEQLRRRADEYELRGTSYRERAELDAAYVASADACVVVAIALREVAAVIEAMAA